MKLGECGVLWESTLLPGGGELEDDLSKAGALEGSESPGRSVSAL